MGSSDIDNVRDATDLVQLIAEHIALKPRGREHVGVCPFHDDHRPSFAVVTHKSNAFYKCHSCGAAGDAFTFVQQYHKMDFPDALRFLAERVNITLTDRRDEAHGDGRPTRSDMRKASAYAGSFFQSILRDPVQGQEARDVIEKRGIADEMVERFSLGAAPNQWDALTTKLRSKPSAMRVATSAGLLKERGSGDGHYDTFRNRLIFPISDETGKPIAFGGRIIDPEDEPKYLNSPESPIFNKSKTLYGLHQAKRTIIDTGQAIVTEGYTDVIACHQAGIENVVATLGTALTREHASILGRLCDTVVLVFDGDEAGLRAADRAVEIFFSSPVDVRIGVLPDRLDPDDLLKQDQGKQRFELAIEASIDALDFKVNRFQKMLATVNSLSGRQKRLEAFLGELADLGFNEMAGVRKQPLLMHLSSLFQVSLSDLLSLMPKRRKRETTASPETTASSYEPESHDLAESMSDQEMSSLLRDAAPVSRARRMAERELLALLIFDPETALRATLESIDGETSLPIAKAFGMQDFIDPMSRSIAHIVLEHLGQGQALAMQELLGHLETQESPRQLASSLYFEAQSRCGDDELAVASQIEAASSVLRHQITLDESRRQPMSEPTLASSGSDHQTLEALIERRRSQGDRPDAIFLGARSSERK
ncbi:MAG: DNA primase [Planctomycetota bacterium]|nr:DNA primase [Planctomycetota bacterium]